jgi:hypothetical protein
LQSYQSKRLRFFYSEDRIWKEFKEHGDAASFGARWTAFSRASVAPTLATSLDNNTARAAEFTDRLETRMAARLVAAPERLSIPLAKMVLAKGSAASIG